jgi:hypothetical protein
MRTHILTLIALCCALAAGQTRLSPRYQTVYVVSMANSLDQHIASRLTSGRVLWVVLQPSSADAVLTDSVDDNFWSWLDRTYPPAKTESNIRTAADSRTAYPSSNNHRGTIFLIDPRTRLVLWSIYELPKSSTPAELDRSATRITNQLKSAFGKK